MGETALLGRWGGTEFTLVAEDVDDDLAEELLAALRAVRLPDGPLVLGVTGSAGVALVEDTTRVPLEDAIAAAESAVVEAKRAGRDQVRKRRLAPRLRIEGPPGEAERRNPRRWNVRMMAQGAETPRA